VDCRKKKFGCLLLIFVVIALVLLGGCGSNDQAQKKPAGASGGQQEIKIAVSLADLERDGNQIIRKTMTSRQGQGRQGGQESNQQDKQGQQAVQNAMPVQAGGQGDQQNQQSSQNQRVNITWLDAKNDPERQEKDLEQLVNQKVKVVILQPVDPSAGPRLVRRLAQANIKVIALDTLPANSPLDGFIAPDYARAGELQSRYLINMARSRSAPMKTVILQGDKNDQSSREITSAVLSNLKEQPQVQVVLVKDHAGGDPKMAIATLEQVLVSTNNQIDAVLSTDSRITAAVIEMLKSKGLSQRILTIGVGAGQQASRALAAGDHDSEVDVMPELVAQYAFDAAVGLATTGHWQSDKQVNNGDFDVPARVTPVRLVTSSESYLLEQRWGKTAGQEGSQSGQQGQQQGQQGSQTNQPAGQQQGSSDGSKEGSRKTTLRITTQDGKTVEMQINGEIKKIETVDSTGGSKGEGSQGQAGEGAGAR